MQKPKAPKKPRKGDLPPSPTISKVKRLAQKRDKSFVLLDLEDKTYCTAGEPDYHKCEQADLEIFNEDCISSDTLKEISKVIKTDFEMRYDADNGYIIGPSFIIKEPNLNYQKELDAFNDRFNKYQKDYILYQEKLKVYNEYSSLEKVEKLKKQIEKQIEKQIQRFQKI